MGKYGSEPGADGDARTLADMDNVVIVSAEVAAVPFTVRDDGEKLHAAPVGNPEHANVTVPVNPPLGVIVSVDAAVTPGPTEPAGGLAAMAKSADTAFTARLTALEVLLAKVGSPLYCAVSKCVPSDSVATAMEAVS